MVVYMSPLSRAVILSMCGQTDRHGFLSCSSVSLIVPFNSIVERVRTDMIRAFHVDEDMFHIKGNIC